MELKLEKTCEICNLKEGFRYSISIYPSVETTLVVVRDFGDYLEFLFLDGTKAGIFKSRKISTLKFYEMPYTPLEQELL